MKERQRQLEVMGISVHNVGIAVDQNKFYLVRGYHEYLYLYECLYG